MHRSLVESEDQLYALNETLEHSAAERTAEAQARAKQLQELALALADAEARERKRLAQILHDHFQQLLSAAKLRAGMLRRAATDQKFIEGAQQLERLLEEAIQASHSLTNELSPPVLYDAGLNAAIKVLVRSLEQRNSLRITVTLDDRAEPAVEQIKVLLYEAIRELLHNVLRHAKATTATVTSKVMDDGKIEIVVSDSGQGFDTASLTSRHGRKGTQFGLLEIRERLRFIGGDVGITSQVGSGTHVRLLVPAEVRPVTETMAHSDRNTPVVPKVRASLPKGAVARVVVADDHAIFREGLISLLAHEPAIKVVGIAADGAQTLKITRELRPDLLLLDVTMPLMNGIEVASVLSREIPELRIVGLSMHKQQDMAAAMLDAGAMAYFTKGGSSEVLLSMLRDIL